MRYEPLEFHWSLIRWFPAVKVFQSCTFSPIFLLKLILVYWKLMWLELIVILFELYVWCLLRLNKELYSKVTGPTRNSPSMRISFKIQYAWRPWKVAFLFFAIGLVVNTYSNRHKRGWGILVTWAIFKGNIWSGTRSF